MNSKSIIITIVIFVLLVFVGWYLYSLQSQFTYTSSYSSDTTASISNDLNQVPDDSSVNSEFNSLDQSMQGF